MVVVEGVGQPLRQLSRVVIVDINQRGNAVAFLVKRFRRLADAGASEVSDRFRAVLVAAGRDDAVELQHELVVDGDGHALHGGPSRSGMSGITCSKFLPLAHLQLSSPLVTGEFCGASPLGDRRRKESCGHRQHHCGPRVTAAIDRRNLAEIGRKHAQTAYDIAMHETICMTDGHMHDRWCIKRARPDTRSGRAALTDAGVDGGARADRNYQT